MSERNQVRLTTDRYFGSIEDRLENLRSLFEYVDREGPNQSDVINRILSTTDAASADAIQRRLDFLESVDFLSQTDNAYALTDRSSRFLETGAEKELLEGLIQNVSGFDIIIPELAANELSDAELAELLQVQDDFEGGAGVAGRHREWLQILGYVRGTTDGKYTLTEKGTSEVLKLVDSSPTRFSVGEVYTRRELHDDYGGNRRSGISTSAEHPVIFLFTGKGGEAYGYKDQFQPDGTFVYTGEGQDGDMEFSRGNRAIRDHAENGDELHLFEQLGDGNVRYLGQFEYADHRWERLLDVNGNERDAIRFLLRPLGEAYNPQTDEIIISTTQNQSVYMARGYKDPFHRNVARSLATYFSDHKIDRFKGIISDSEEFTDPNLLEILSSETVTAWGAKSDKSADKELFESMDPGDYFVMRTGQPTRVEFIQQIDYKLGSECPSELREALSDTIWTSPDYDLIWFSQTPVIDLDMPEEDFIELVQEVYPEFEIADWFPSQGKNATQIPDEVVDHFGGTEGFIDQLRSWDGTERSPGSSNCFLLDTTQTDVDVASEHIYDFEQKSTDLSQELLDAEYDANLIFHDGSAISAIGRLGNIEGSRRDGSIHKQLYIIDYIEFEPIPFDEISWDIQAAPAGQASFAELSDEPVRSIERADNSLFNQVVDTANIQVDGGSTDQPVDDYSGVTEATSDVLDRLESEGIERTEFRDRLSKSVVIAWTEPLKKIAVKTASDISPAEASLISQIKAVYSDAEPWLTDVAERLGIGSLYDLNPPQVLFMALLRDLQSEIPEIDRVNVNHVKLKTILNDEYNVTHSGEDIISEEAGHDLLSVVENETPVHLLTASPDYLLTAIRYRTVALPAEYREQWDRVSHGDLILINAQSEPRWNELSDQEDGFIAAGILGEKFERPDEAWWQDEIMDEAQFPLGMSFGRIYITGDLQGIGESLRIADQSPAEVNQNLEALTENRLDFESIDEQVEEETGRRIQGQEMFSTFTIEDGNTPEHDRPRVIIDALSSNLEEISPVSLHHDNQPDLSPDLLDGLYFPEGQDVEIIQEVEAALRGGKHIIFTGPPGTGKTEIARQVVGTLVEKYPNIYSGFQITTATADWSTFDTVGGYMPTQGDDPNDDEQLSFNPGTVLNRLRNRTEDIPVNEPLVIDELNRADIDKAFGQLFTVLSGQSVTLPYTRNGSEIEILPVSELDGSPQSHQYVIPESWRMFATMNTYDKTSLYEMSYAFMRRFAFIRVAVPNLKEMQPIELQQLIQEYVTAWETNGDDFSLEDIELRSVGEVWKQTNVAVKERAIGPAIVRDILFYLDNHSSDDLNSRLTNAVIAYIYPQLEGVPKRNEIVEKIAEVEAIDSDKLREVAREMLQVTFEEA